MFAKYFPQMLQDIPLMQSASTLPTIVWQFPSFPRHLINPGSPPTSVFSNIFTNKHLGLGCHAKNVETLVALDPYSGGRGSWRGSEGRVCLCELLELASGKYGRHLDRRHPMEGRTMEGPETKAAPPKPHNLLLPLLCRIQKHKKASAKVNCHTIYGIQ